MPRPRRAESGCATMFTSARTRNRNIQIAKNKTIVVDPKVKEVEEKEIARLETLLSHYQRATLLEEVPRQLKAYAPNIRNIKELNLLFLKDDTRNPGKCKNCQRAQADHYHSDQLQGICQWICITMKYICTATAQHYLKILKGLEQYKSVELQKIQKQKSGELQQLQKLMVPHALHVDAVEERRRKQASSSRFWRTIKKGSVQRYCWVC